MIESGGRTPATGVPTVGLLSPCGWGNLGDAAIQEATIAAIRARWPGARIVAFTLNPEDTRTRHGVPAYPLSGFSRSTYTIVGRSLPRTAEPIDEVLRRLQRVSWIGPLVRVLRGACDFAQSEPLHIALALKWLREIDLLVVSGGGQLDDFWGGTWGHPYALWKWTVLARRTQTPVVMLSVGLGSLRSPLARSFARGALTRTAYRSFRDERTRSGVSRILELEDVGPVVPDLAFGLEPDASRASTVNSGVVGISPIAYLDPRVWPLKDGAAYRRYTGLLGSFVQRLAGAGRRVVLFSTDGPDRVVMDDVWTSAGRPALAERARTETLPDLFTELARVDVVVASRLHGVILAQLAGCPVVALSYDWKVSRHMQEFGQAEYCLEIDAFDVPSLTRAFEKLDTRSVAVRAVVAQRLLDYRSRVRRQFDEVLR